MALTCSAEIEIESISSFLGVSPVKRTVLVEVCIFGDKFCTKYLKTTVPLVFHEKFKYKKEFDKKMTLPCLIELFKDSLVVFNLLEVVSQKYSCKSQMNVLATTKMPVSIFFFPPSHIKKYHTIKMFPFKSCKPILKFWVDAIIYRSSSSFLSSQIAKLKQNDLMKQLKCNKVNECGGKLKPVKTDHSKSCVVCKTYLKYLGRPYCGHNHPATSTRGKKSSGDDNDDDNCNDDNDGDDHCNDDDDDAKYNGSDMSDRFTQGNGVDSVGNDENGTRVLAAIYDDCTLPTKLTNYSGLDENVTPSFCDTVFNKLAHRTFFNNK